MAAAGKTATASTAKPATAPDAKGKSKPRSPSYPGLTLEVAIQKARTIHEREGRNEAAESVILGDLGYKSKSGPAIVALAAVKAFGLLIPGKGANTLKLSDLATRIILDRREDETERRVAIQQAALNPAMHKALWEKYGGDLPSDANVIYFLRMERAFTEPGAKAFIGLYRATLAFAGLVGGGRLSQPARDEDRTEEGDMSTPLPATGKPPTTPPPPPGVREVALPIAGTAWPSIRAAFPLSEAAWEDMLRVLQAMKSGLVAPPTKDEPGD